ncbi:MAG: hypothetical protein AMJ53_00175 [Gammaproteobacteria bacterium SG8_11]|nr:MAG: hypothetical protein AMJ53_00175 [Gammaproteobacteria bacterium SG8_11]
MKAATTATLTLRFFSFWKIPLIYFVRTSVVSIDEEKVVIKIPFRRRTKNHLRSMYFAVLAIGADVAGGMIAWNLIRKSPHKISLIFKSFHADFLKRVEGDALFTCTQGKEIAQLVEEAIQSEERVEKPIEVIATVPDEFADEPVAKFELLLSLKRRT